MAANEGALEPGVADGVVAGEAHADVDAGDYVGAGTQHSSERQAKEEFSTDQLRRHACWNPIIPEKVAAAAAAAAGVRGAGTEADPGWLGQGVAEHAAAEAGADEGYQGQRPLLEDFQNS